MKITDTARSLAHALMLVGYSYNDDLGFMLKNSAIELLETAKVTEALHIQACKGRKVKAYRAALKQLNKLVREARSHAHSYRRIIREVRHTLRRKRKMPPVFCRRGACSPRR